MEHYIKKEINEFGETKWYCISIYEPDLTYKNEVDSYALARSWLKMMTQPAPTTVYRPTWITDRGTAERINQQIARMMNYNITWR